MEHLLHNLASDTGSGSMKASATARQVLRGSDVTLSCWLNKGSSCGSQPKIFIFHNNTEVTSSDGHSASASALLSTFGQQTFECLCSRRPTNVLFCGIYIYVGIPPDQPKNTVCIQYGKGGATHCTWEKGRYTYLATNYTLQLKTNGTARRVFVEMENNDTHGSVDLRDCLDYGPTYTAVVHASNDLGTTSSQPIQFTQIDIECWSSSGERVDLWEHVGLGSPANSHCPFITLTASQDLDTALEATTPI
ncbi:hypothetical protein lerEdw1_011765 [Lerista edwardsae]|nr:hypothetical protein lerEdw1_011765 [Lerista edwardsae]